MEKIKGIVLYNIELNGCLNGVYTNNMADGIIFNEIAKLRKKFSEDEFEGDYDCFYFDKDPIRNDAELIIRKVEGKHRTYSFRLNVDGKARFNGIGYKMNEKQLAVHYWDGELY